MSSRDVLFDIASEFETVDADELARVDRFLGYAAAQLSYDTWEEQYTMGCVYLTAHMLKMRAMSSAGDNGGGPVSSRKAEQLAISYAVPQGDAEDAALQSTRYGQEFLRLRSSLVMGPVVLGMDEIS